MSSFFNYRHILLACLLSTIGFFLFFKLGAIPLCDPDEPRYAQSAREMNERGSYMVPYFNHEPRLNKPVVYYWIISISYKLFGVSEFSARLGSVLAALALLGATFFFVSRVRDTLTAFLSCVILGSSPLFFVPARLSMPDMVFSTLMILSLYCFYLGWQEKASPQKNAWYMGFYFFQVAAAWTKGPVGILIPLAVAVISLLREKDRQELRSLRLSRGVPCVLLASIPWYLYIFFFVNSAAMAEMSTSETISRVIGGQGRNYEPMYYYVPAVIGGLFPWIFLLPWALHKRLRRKERDRPNFFLETWFLFVLVFFSLCASKKFQYIICLSSVFSIWLASVCAEAFRLQARVKDAGLIATLFILFLVVLVGCFTGISWVSKKEPSLIMGGCMVFFTLMVPLGISLWLSV
ncbi:MAG: glycosyltransferase family 39 protein [Pseudomonadota bacterium]